MPFDWNLVVGPASLVVGTTLGWFLQHRSESTRLDREEQSEQRRWQRDQRLDAYLGFVGPAQQFMFRGALLDRTDYTDDTRPEASAQLNEVLDALGQAVGRMAFLAPKPLTQMAMEIELLCIEAIGLVLSPTPIQGTSSGKAHWLALGHWVGAWAAGAQADLDGGQVEQVPLDLPTTGRWIKGQGWIDGRLTPP